MNKRGITEYTAFIALGLVLVIMIAIMVGIAIKQAPHEERINNLKAIDLGLTLDVVSSLEGDLYLNYDLGDGMNVEILGDEITMYTKSESKAGKETFIRNPNFEDLLEGKYENLYINKKGNVIKIEYKRSS